MNRAVEFLCEGVVYNPDKRFQVERESKRYCDIRIVMHKISGTVYWIDDKSRGRGETGGRSRRGRFLAKEALKGVRTSIMGGRGGLGVELRVSWICGLERRGNHSFDGFVGFRDKIHS